MGHKTIVPLASYWYEEYASIKSSPSGGKLKSAFVRSSMWESVYIILQFTKTTEILYAKIISLAGITGVISHSCWEQYCFTSLYGFSLILSAVIISTSLLS